MSEMSPRALRSALEEVALTTENLQGLPAELAAMRHDLSTEVRRYMTPRLTDTVESLVIAVVGPGGVGKSALVNDIVGREVSEEGAIRPTTTTPVRLTGVAKDASASLGVGSSLSRPRLIDAPVLGRLVLIDMPATAPVSRIRPADLALVVVSPERYADAYVWGLVNELDEFGVQAWLVMNRSRGRADEAVEDLRTLTKDVGRDIPVFAVAERNLIGQHQTDGGLTELKNALIELGLASADEASKSVLRRADRLAGTASTFVRDADAFLDERVRLAEAISISFASMAAEGAAVADDNELAASAEQDWKVTVEDLTDRFSRQAEAAVAALALQWRQSAYGGTLLETHEGRDLSKLPEASENEIRQQLLGWRDEVSRNVRAKLRRNPRQAKIAELIEAVRIEALGGSVKLGWLAKRRLSAPVEDLAKESRRRLRQTLSSLGEYDAARFTKRLGPGPTREELDAVSIAVGALHEVLGYRDG